METKRFYVHSGIPHELVYYQFAGLARQGSLTHGVFTRHGGVSHSPYDTLNVSYSTGDRPGAVSKNLQMIKEAICARHLVFMNQVHGREILLFREEDAPRYRETYSADAMITDIPGLALMVKQADCQAVILFDPKNGVIANVHCGWRGNTCDILGAVVRRMRSYFGCRGSDMMAAIGPSLGPCCAEFTTHEKIFPSHFKGFMVRENYFDLWKMSRWQLMEAGLAKRNIELAGECTRCRTDLFYSYRAEKVTGRFGTVVMIKSPSDFI